MHVVFHICLTIYIRKLIFKKPQKKYLYAYIPYISCVGYLCSLVILPVHMYAYMYSLLIPFVIMDIGEARLGICPSNVWRFGSEKILFVVVESIV
jgi:hypothetical protein